MNEVNPEAAKNINPDAESLQKREIHPATRLEIKQAIDQSYNFSITANEYSYTRNRTSQHLLEKGNDYAELPGYANQAAREIIENLPENSKMLDVGCGHGQFGAEILGTITVKSPHDDDFDEFIHEVEQTPAINKNISVYGYDSTALKGQDRLTGMAIGNIDDLSAQTFINFPEGFDLIISSSVLYHLPDYWGGILRMADLLTPKGLLLSSTMPRVLAPDHARIEMGAAKTVDDERGNLTSPDDGNHFYYRNRNVFDTNGKIVPPGELVDILNKYNPAFPLEYSVASAPIQGAKAHGGQISGQRLSDKENLDLSSMYYCLSKDSLGYIIAKTPQEQEILQKQGYINVQQRFTSTN